MPFDAWQRDVEDAPLTGKGEAYEGPASPTPYLCMFTRPQLEAMLADCDAGGSWFHLERLGERGIGGNRTHILKPAGWE